MTQILRKAIESPIFSKEVLPKAPLSIFEGSEIYKDLANIIKRYYQTNTNKLTEETLLTLTEDKLDRMRKPSDVQQEYFNKIHALYDIRDSRDDEVIDEKIEKYIRKHMWMELLKKAAMNLDKEEVMEKVADEWKQIMMLDISGKQQEIINVIDDTEYKRKLLETLNQNIIPTGFKAIDNLNGGGLARGELGMIVAMSGSGKCVTGDTMIYTEKGIIEIQDVPKYFDVDSENRLNAFVASYTQNGEYVPRDTSHWYNLGKSKTLRVTTKSGYSVEGTPEHPLLVMNREGNLEYVELQDLKQGDYLALAKPNMWSDVNQISEEEAYMMALLVADGYVAQDSGLVSFSNS
ncbi:Hint domain-containing protein [Collinsella aerofaciens]|uniref:Hint domain-containing protein n=1 Tax=Collinsella aerofaciens TaxID=74426 RepID=UPI001D027EFE|nr:Hint domain-containing protein [Collinsella aerofaciens]MCB5366925.1 Hint domain-containing protein [Collinsella aerofaciens]